ncbi:putative germin-like protein 2-1 [Solanum dulcamara]|uniref:putative germin-like protein 2-1 n=1 Tax=Solanum dulcamara TaxID=45834 RepID=UPI0024869E41|nr:putative germin-like protein 2-1 [Solanum dulcamara]XP_055815123.1 putative germin-like protein 2-1 [Solanum dulcamara]
MRMWWFITTLVITSFFSNFPVYAYDNNPLQNICVAAVNSTVFVNGKTCKDPKFATANDFFASGLNVSGIAAPGSGAAAKFLDVSMIPGLNTLGISIGRIDLEPQRLVPFHTHPRATELITVLKGTLYVGFLVPDPENFLKSRLFSKILNPGDVFVFPIGLIHFQYNVGLKQATFLAAFNSQNPGFVFIPNSIFASNPPIQDDVLAQGFQLSKTQITELQKKFS